METGAPFVHPYLTVAEAAEYLRLSQSFLKKAVAGNRIPHKHVGRRVILSRAELDQWVDSKPGVGLENNKGE